MKAERYPFVRIFFIQFLLLMGCAKYLFTSFLARITRINTVSVYVIHILIREIRVIRA